MAIAAWLLRADAPPTAETQNVATQIPDSDLKVSDENTAPVLAAVAETPLPEPSTEAAPDSVGSEPEGDTSESSLVIEGRIFDADTGEGIPRFRVRAMAQDSIGKTFKSPATDEEGRFRITGLSAGRYSLETGQALGETGMLFSQPPLYMSQSVTLTADNNPTAVEFAMKLGLSITGRVFDHKGDPVSKAHIVRKTAGDAPSTTQSPVIGTQSDTDGSFLMAGLSPAEELYIMASKDGWYSDILGPLALTAEGLSDVTLRMLASPTGSIQGSVVDQDGNPAPNVKIYATTQTFPFNFYKDAQSDAEGMYSMENLPDEIYTVYVNYPHYRQGLKEPVEGVEVARGRATYLEPLIYKKGLDITGIVVDADGAPIPGASIEAQWSSLTRTVSRENGGFHFRDLPEGKMSVVASKKGYSGARIRTASGTKDLRLVLLPLGAITGTVVDANTGNPVTLFDLTLSGRGTALVRFENPEGRFDLDGVNVLSRYLSVEAPGYVFARHEVEVPVSGDAPVETQVELVPGAIVTGIVLDPRRRPVSGAEIFITRSPLHPKPNYDRLAATTGPDGAFRLNEISSEHREIAVIHPDYARASVAVSPDPRRATRVEVVLEHGGSIEGLVTVYGGTLIHNSHGGPYHGSFYLRFPDRLALDNLYGEIGNDGTFTQAGIASGPAELHITLFSDRHHPGDYLSAKMIRQIDIPQGEAATVSFDHRPGRATLEGTIAPDDTVRLRNQIFVRYQQTGDTERFYYTAVNEDRYFRLFDLPAGSATLEINYWRDGESGEFSYTEELFLGNEPNFVDVTLSH